MVQGFGDRREGVGCGFGLAGMGVIVIFKGVSRGLRCFEVNACTCQVYRVGRDIHAHHRYPDAVW